MHEQDILARALALTNEAARATFVREACGGDEQLRRRVEQHVAQAEQSTEHGSGPVSVE